ncbi:acetoacetate--CoA ligase [Mycolicibacterium sp. ELW1]|uniref:acetoacetate--CoA ligase n=1 Tax=unclassified Mycolicibacterium TaxID=2636767 RepID=UPI003D77B819
MPGPEPQWKQFAATTAAHHGAPSDDYAELWQWSVEHPARFWRAVWEYFDVRAEAGPQPGDAGVLADASMPGAIWFPGVRLNYVDQILRHTSRAGAAIVGIDEDGTRTEISWSELAGRVGAVAAELRRLGVQAGDRVAGYLPDVAEAMIAFLATASIGAVWSACGQDYAPEGAASRLAQLEPKVLFSAGGYRVNGRWFDKRADTEELLDLLPGRPHLLMLDGDDYLALAARPATPEVSAVPFDHPLWVLFSSGTTGKPKGIVHGHGGVVLEHLKAAALHGNLGPEDVFFWQTALSWMMWNFRIAGLLCASTVVCYSGHPLCPDADRLWQLLEDEKVTYFGTSPGHLLASRKAGLHPGTTHDLRRLRTIGSTGSPLPADLFEWVHQEVGEDVAVSSISGGTDVVTAFAGGTAGLPEVPGELTTRYLGAALYSWSPQRRSLTDEVGEMVITAPMPSMPVGFWSDDDGSRYRAAYFDHQWSDGPAPGVWRHGDWVTVTDRGSLIIHGRSDATLNRHGIRMGSADIYEVVEAIDAVTEGFVLGIDGPDGAYWMPLFVTLAAGHTLDDELVDTIRSAIRTKLSPRHVPDDIIAAPGIPHTRTGKKLEVPVTAIMAGHADVSLDPRSIDNPDLIDWFRTQGAQHRWTS